MILDSFIQLLPILLIIGGGFLLSKIYHIHHDTLVKIIVDFFMPMLIFHALYTSSLSGDTILRLTGVTTLVIALLFVTSFIYIRITKVEMRQFVPPVLFMNSGFVGIPLMKLWSGIAAMNVVIVYDQIQSIYIFTLGILIISGGISAKNLKELIKSPILWAIIGGFTFRFLDIPLPQPLLTTFEFGGNAAPPLAALIVGIALGETKPHLDRHLAAALIIRIVGGSLCGLLGAEIFGLTGITRTVVIVASGLPSAVFTSVLPMRYGVKADFAGTMVVVSTILGIITIPLTFWLASVTG